MIWNQIDVAGQPHARLRLAGLPLHTLELLASLLRTNAGEVLA